MAWATDFVITVSDLVIHQPDVIGHLLSGSIDNVISGSKGQVEDEVLKPLVTAKYKSKGLKIPDDLPGGDGTELDEILPTAYPQIRRKIAFHALKEIYRIRKDVERREDFEEKYANAGLNIIIIYIDTDNDDTLDADEHTNAQDLLDDCIR